MRGANSAVSWVTAPNVARRFLFIRTAPEPDVNESPQFATARVPPIPAP